MNSVFWNRIHDSRIKSLINQCQRYYHLSSGVVTTSANCIATFSKTTTTTTRFSERSLLFDRNGAVRFYAAPILPNQTKPESKAKNKVRINEKIPAEFIRLVVDDGHEVVSRSEALDRARKLDMDLVEVDRVAKPPVCRIMDYHREMYKKQVKAKEKSKIKAENSLRSGSTKECRFTKKTEQKDLETKAKNVKRALEKGHRVKCMATGTEDQDLGAMLARLSALIEDFAVVESGPMVEKKQAYVVVRHKKFGFKKGSSKKSSMASPSTTPTSINSEQVQGPSEIEEESDHAELHSESEDIDPDQMDLAHAGGDKMAWSTADATEDVDVFGFDEKNKGGRMSGNTDGVFPLEHIPNASLPYSNPKPEAIKSRLLSPAGPRQVDEKRFSGGNEVRSRFQPPLTERPADSRYEVSPPRHTSQGYRGPVPHGPAQVTENRYKGASTIPRGPTQVRDNRYNGQADVRSRFQHPNPIERTVENAKLSPVHSPQFSRGLDATSPVHHGSPSTEHKPLRAAAATPVGNFKMPPKDESLRREQADPNVAGPQRPSYGIFSAPKQATRTVATEQGVSREHSPLDSSERQPRSCENNQRPELGKWGTFSKEAPKTYQQTKVQR